MLQQQIGDLLRKVPIVDMSNILEEVFTVNVDDIKGHQYDQRFAAFFGINQLEFDVKTELQEEQNANINPSSNINNEPCTSATALARYAASINTSQHIQPLEEYSAIAANEDTSSIVWNIDCDDEMGNRTYDERFARYFGLPQNQPPHQVKQEEAVEPFEESSQTHDIPAV